VVTANGKFITVNAQSNPRLFWALRGGGGGTFGVVTSVTYKLHPKVPVSGLFIIANFTSPALAQQIVTEFVRIHPTLSDKGWGGYGSFSATSGLSIFWAAPNASQAEVQETVLPFTDFLVSTTAGQLLNATAPFDSFFDWYDFIFAQASSQVGSQSKYRPACSPRIQH
jgi:FAD/FMN-containing dehydrogenase